jgi:two-component system, HptB-dependent secretion and biofilm response regulator
MAARVLVGDLTGHGLVASIGTVPIAEVFYGITDKGFSIPELIAEINDKTRRILPIGRFLAAAVCISSLHTRASVSETVACPM